MVNSKQGGLSLPRLSIKERLTCHLRVLPDFVIIGAMKCGTTSLYDYLVQHPSVVSATVKEIHFFDNSFPKGMCWYRNHFPLALHRWLHRLKGHQLITGEATPHYMFQPHVPERMHAVIPNAMLIALLRNPIDRAYSQYQHQVRQGREKETFENALRLESQRIGPDLAKLKADKNHVSMAHGHYSYLSRGIYIDQLLAYERFYPRERMLILQAEDLFGTPQAVYDKTLQFLNLTPHKLTKFKIINAGGSYEKIPANVRIRLAEFYAPHNERLFNYLGYSLNW